MKYIILFLTLILMAGNTSATNYYISPNGNNGNTGLSIEQAWYSLSYAINNSDLVGPGTMIYLLDGTYYDPHTLIWTTAKSGNYTDPVIITAYNGTPIIDGLNSSIMYSSMYVGINPYVGLKYITFDGFKITNFSKTPIYIRNAADINILNMTLDTASTNDYAPLQVHRGSRNITINNNNIVDSGYNSIDVGGLGTDNVNHTYNITISNNKISGNSKHWAIQFGLNCSDVTINNNYIHDNPYGGGINAYLGTDGQFMRNFTIQNNTLIDAEMAIGQGTNGTIKDNTINGDAYTGYGNYYPASDDMNNIVYSNNTQYNTNKELYFTGGKDLLFIQNNITTSSEQQYKFSHMYGGTITLRDTIQNYYSINVIHSGNITIEYTDNKIFKKSGTTTGTYTENETRFYPTYSNYSYHISDLTTSNLFNITTYNITFIPETGYGKDITVNTDLINDITNITANVSEAATVAMTFLVDNSTQTYQLNVSGEYNATAVSDSDSIVEFEYVFPDSISTNFEVSWNSTEGWYALYNTTYINKTMTFYIENQTIIPTNVDPTDNIVHFWVMGS